MNVIYQIRFHLEFIWLFPFLEICKILFYKKTKFFKLSHFCDIIIYGINNMVEHLPCQIRFHLEFIWNYMELHGIMWYTTFIFVEQIFIIFDYKENNKFYEIYIFDVF